MMRVEVEHHLLLGCSIELRFLPSWCIDLRL